LIPKRERPAMAVRSISLLKPEHIVSHLDNITSCEKSDDYIPFVSRIEYS